MRKVFILFFIGLLIILGIGCSSTPDTTATPEPNPLTEPTPTPKKAMGEETPDPAKIPLSESEIQEARTAITRAEEVEADTYAPGLLKEAVDALEKGIAQSEPDPAGARASLELCKKKAGEAYDKSVDALAKAYSLDLRLGREKLKEIEADLYAPGEYTTLVKDVEKTTTLFDEGNILEGRHLGQETLTGMNNLYDRTVERLKWVAIQKKDVETYLEEAEVREAYLWTPNSLQKVNNYYFLGIEARNNYNLDEAEFRFGTAKELAVDMLVEAEKLKKQKETEDLKNEVLSLLEETSKMTIVTEDGEVVDPDPINIDEFISNIEEEQLKEEAEDSAPQAFLSRLRVLSDVTRDNLLAQAKELIRLGVLEEKKGNLEQAKEYYTQARDYLNLYKAQSVKKVYTVRLIPERRDCLWRIAEYDDIYGTPYLWPLIWRRNRKLIQNPNLIYPGWQLVIPEK